MIINSIHFAAIYVLFSLVKYIRKQSWPAWYQFTFIIPVYVAFGGGAGGQIRRQRCSIVTEAEAWSIYARWLRWKCLWTTKREAFHE